MHNYRIKLIAGAISQILTTLKEVSKCKKAGLKKRIFF